VKLSTHSSAFFYTGLDSEIWRGSFGWGWTGKPGKCALVGFVPINLTPVLWIRINRIRMFLGLLDADPDLLVRGTEPDPDSSFIKQKKGKPIVL
jgi:hypothetical protein